MIITDTTLTISDICIFAYHGVLPAERRIGNDYTVTVTVTYDGAAAARTDDINRALNYAGIIDTVRTAMATPADLIENAAARIAADLCTRYPQITRGTVAVTKIHPPVTTPVGGATVTLTFEPGK